VISDVNGNLVEYVLDVVVDTSKTSSGSRPSNDSPVYLRLTPKAQWPLQRFISSEEVKYPIQADNPLLLNGFSTQTHHGLQRKPSNVNPQNHEAGLFQLNSYSPNSGMSSMSSTTASYTTAPSSLSHQQYESGNKNSKEWMKQIEVSSHIGPHRRLFMGPQFVFKTFNSSITTTMLNAGSSAVIGDGNNTPIIDLSDDIELNTLE
jgi:hypothetical protein